MREEREPSGLVRALVAWGAAPQVAQDDVHETGRERQTGALGGHGHRPADLVVAHRSDDDLTLHQGVAQIGKALQGP